MVPFENIVGAITLQGDIELIGVEACGVVEVVIRVPGILRADIGSEFVLCSGIDKNLRGGGFAQWSEDEIPVFIDVPLGDAIGYSSGGGVPAGADTTEARGSGVIKVDFPGKVRGFQAVEDGFIAGGLSDDFDEELEGE